MNQLARVLFHLELEDQIVVMRAEEAARRGTWVVVPCCRGQKLAPT